MLANVFKLLSSGPVRSIQPLHTKRGRHSNRSRACAINVDRGRSVRFNKT
jgi:hypothetical protein